MNNVLRHPSPLRRLFGSCPWSQSDRRRSPWVSTHGRPSRQTISSRSDDGIFSARSATNSIPTDDPAFNRRSATNHACVIVLRGLKPTATVKCRSATGGVSRWSVRVVAARQRRVSMPRSRSLRRGRANEEEMWIVDGAITATSTAIPQTAGWPGLKPLWAKPRRLGGCGRASSPAHSPAS